jgi:hypothetical protein
MGRNLISICIVLVLASLLCTSANAANLLVNGDFELGSGNVATSWSGFNSSAGGWNNRETANNPIPGNYLMAIGAAEGYGAGEYQDVAGIAGVTYTLSADASLDAWWKNAGYLKIEFYDAGGTDPVNMVGFAELSPHFAQPGYDTGLPWANYNISGLAPAGTVTVRAMLGTWGEGGTARFDNAVLTPEPATLAILGLGGLLLRRRK